LSELEGAGADAWFWEMVLERARPKAVPKEKAAARLAAINRFVIIIILYSTVIFIILPFMT
jgi:hypothetical protein